MRTGDVLAAERTRLANERTLLAYARTGMGIVACGVTVATVFDSTRALLIGIAVSCVGAATLLLGWVRFARAERRIQRVEDAAGA